jgi:hypothetical protein
MKKFLFVLALFIIVLFAFSPFLPERFINIESNIPLKAEDIFTGFDGFYFTYYTKIPAVVHRKLLKVNINYEEKAICNIKFTNGISGITKNGQVIKEAMGEEPSIIANFEEDKWNDEFAKIFLILSIYNYVDKIKNLEIYENNIAFFDKKDILIIMGNDNLERNFKEYLKILQMFSLKISEIKSIDLRYNNQAVIVWRGK